MSPDPQPMTGRRCRRCGSVPMRWSDLSPTARTIVALVQLHRDVDVPASAGVITELRSYLRHEPHTVPAAGERERDRNAKLERARRFLMLTASAG